jgi:hydroxyethylthiazole kinase-like sugar kinase family protein
METEMYFLKKIYGNNAELQSVCQATAYGKGLDSIGAIA